MGRTKFRLGRKQEHLKARLASGELEEAREFEHLDSTVWEDGKNVNVIIDEEICPKFIALFRLG